MRPLRSPAPTQSLPFNDPTGSLPTGVVPEQICRDRILHGGEGCEAGMISLRGDSPLTEELVAPVADTSLERGSQMAGLHPFLSSRGLACDQPLTMPPAFIWAVHLCRYAIPTSTAWFKV